MYILILFHFVLLILLVIAHDVVIDERCDQHEITCPDVTLYGRPTNDARFIIGQLGDSVIVGNLTWHTDSFPDTISPRESYVLKVILYTDSNKKTATRCFNLNHQLSPFPQSESVMPRYVRLDCVTMVSDWSAKMQLDVIRRSCDVTKVTRGEGLLDSDGCYMQITSSSVIDIGKSSCEYYERRHFEGEVTLTSFSLRNDVCFRVKSRFNPFSKIELTVHTDSSGWEPHRYLVLPVTKDLSGHATSTRCFGRHNILSDQCYAKLLYWCPGGRLHHFISATINCSTEPVPLSVSIDDNKEPLPKTAPGDAINVLIPFIVIISFVMGVAIVTLLIVIRKNVCGYGFCVWHKGSTSPQLPERDHLSSNN